MDTLLTAAKFAVPVVIVGITAAALVGGCNHRRTQCPGTSHLEPQEMEEKLDRHLERLFDEVAATAEQRSRILAVRDRLVPGHRKLHARCGSLEKEFFAAWGQESLDDQALHSLVDERAQEMTDFAHKVVASLAEVHRTLTPEQREALLEKMTSRRWR